MGGTRYIYIYVYVHIYIHMHTTSMLKDNLHGQINKHTCIYIYIHM